MRDWSLGNAPSSTSRHKRHSFRCCKMSRFDRRLSVVAEWGDVYTYAAKSVTVCLGVGVGGGRVFTGM